MNIVENIGHGLTFINKECYDLSMLKLLKENPHCDSGMISYFGWRHLWSFDCLVLSVLLSLACDGKKIIKIFKRHAGIKDLPSDEFVGFHLLHQQCHLKDSTIALSLENWFNQQSNAVIQKVRKVDEHDDRSIRLLSCEEWVKHPFPTLWAFISDERCRMHQHGVYLVHKYVLQQSKCFNGHNACQASFENKISILTYQMHKKKVQFNLLQEELSLLRDQLGKEKNENQKLREVNSQLETKIKNIKDSEINEGKLLHVIRKLKYELNKVSQEKESSYVIPTCGHNQNHNCACKMVSDALLVENQESYCSSEKSNDQEVVTLSSNKIQSLALVGGLERMALKYKQIVEEMGISFLYHNGECSGGSTPLKTIVQKSDVVLFITNVNGHGALDIVKKSCKKLNKGFMAINKCGPQTLRQIIENIPTSRAV
ncbi:MAG: DUF2325 domain-containing protein [Oligoflexia bacterium]|nr:DUF2325 domain-containing protein [Oligoflexia bacterium]